MRGLDYYTRTVFEFVSSAIGSQGTICGGGRYDGLVAELGGPPTPGVGFGLGIERFLMVVAKLTGEQEPPRRGIQAIALGDAARERLVGVVGALRALSPEPTFAEWLPRKLTAHFKVADRNHARWALILGDDELAKGELVLRTSSRARTGGCRCPPPRRRSRASSSKPRRDGSGRSGPRPRARRDRRGVRLGRDPRPDGRHRDRDRAARPRRACPRDLRDARCRGRAGTAGARPERRLPTAAAATAGANVRKATAPVVGVFYRSANPDAEPYVEVGSRVARATRCASSKR